MTADSRRRLARPARLGMPGPERAGKFLFSRLGRTEDFPSTPHGSASGRPYSCCSKPNRERRSRMRLHARDRKAGIPGRRGCSQGLASPAAEAARYRPGRKESATIETADRAVRRMNSCIGESIADRSRFAVRCSARDSVDLATEGARDLCRPRKLQTPTSRNGNAAGQGCSGTTR